MKAAATLVLLAVLVSVVAKLEPHVLRPLFSTPVRPAAATSFHAAVSPQPGRTATPGATVTALGNRWIAADPETRERLLDEFATAADVPLIPALLRYAIQRGPADMRFPLQRALLRRLTLVDPQYAARLVAAYLSGSDRAIVRLELALAWADRDLPAAVSWLAQWEAGNARATTVRALIQQLADGDPVYAAAKIAVLPPGRFKLDLLAGFAEEWGRRNFDEVLVWAKSLTDDTERTQVLLRLGNQWQQREPNAALAYALAFPDHNDLLATQWATHLAQRDPLAATEWAITLPAGERRDRILASVMVTGAQQNPSETAALATLLPSGSVRQEALAAAIAAWMMRDTGSVAEWVRALPASRLQEYAIEQVASRWREADPAMTVLWLNRLPTEPTEEAATARWRQILKAAQAWLLVDPVAARNWILASNLPHPYQQDLLQGPSS